MERRCTAEGRTDGWFDSDRVTQVISNLVTNGIRPRAAGAPVTVALRGSDQEIWMEVHNEGPPSRRRCSLTSSSVRQEAPRPKATPGLGLGLFIAQQIVAAHGGSIELQSKDEEGTTVRARWPRRDSQPSARP